MRVTIEDIARMANVSKATVSRVINGKKEGVGEKTRKRVQQIIDEANYSPSLLAKGIVTSKTKTLGMVIPDITNPFFTELVRYVERYAGQNNFSVILCDSDGSPEKEEQCLQILIVKRVDGIVLVSSSNYPGETHIRLQKYGIPCVLLDRKLEFDYPAYVTANNEYAIYYATEYLIRHGNKRIAFLSGSLELSTSVERIRGYYQALEQYQLPIDETLIKIGDFTLKSGYRLVKELEAKEVGFSAVLVGSDIMAVGVMKALKESGKRIPQDIEVIGFDNIKICTAMDPELTTIEQPVNEMGEYAVRILLDIIEGKAAVKRRFRLKPRFVIRETTKKEFTW